MKDILSSIERYKEWIANRGGMNEETAGQLAVRADEIDKDIHALIRIDADRIGLRGRVLAELPDKPVLKGVPAAIKDNICISGELTTCASKVLEGFRPPYNATVIDKLEKAGALLFPSANMDEFAFGSSCESSFYGPTRNPWDISRIPGGSSGGAAAAVAAGEVAFSLGSDTGGSIRQPASLCGVVGLKPTYGRVSRYGLIAFASSLDQIGPVTRNVTDSARVLETIAGYDHRDSTSVDMEVPAYVEQLTGDISGTRIGIPREFFREGIDEQVLDRVMGAVSKLESLGAEVSEVSLPHTRYAVSCYYIIGPAEASSNLGRYDGAHYGHRSDKTGDMIDMYIDSRSEGFGEEAKRRVLLGTYSLSSGYYDAYYIKAQKVRTRIADDFKKIFSEYDCVVTPTSPTTAFRIGEKVDDPLKMYLSDVFTISANLAGIPAISVPCGFTDEGLPVGMQIMAEAFNESTMLNTAYAFEQATDHHLRVPAHLDAA
ncbi:MAG: Asp-tRNA(Asn)/Glu-tRNA(Gln) amidotransferase subunit GatA [Candidatus Omnitrophica bacterium]|nr:Asp-tRNA(Asn)/Glu-tRNA(Gln) amidotransferase subunit GatA [Candidatus Omnitrophota bacterium]